MSLATSPRLAQLQRLTTAINAAVVIDPQRLELLLAALLAGGHVLLEDVPGIGKTLIAKALAQAVDATFRRIQCTPDLLPGDITGSAIYNQRDQAFEFVAGPIFAQIVLVDEINRASPRTQSSLLEAMAEGQVTSDGITRTLPHPFFLIATQNPIEMAGTFPLPEAQLDRFLIAMDLGYPSRADELLILEREEHDNPLAQLTAQMSMAELADLQHEVRRVSVSRALKEYIVSFNEATRIHSDAVLGVSPRGGVSFQRCSQALALLRGRDFVTPDDLKTAARAALPHRILTRDRHLDSARALIEELLGRLRVPLA